MKRKTFSFRIALLYLAIFSGFIGSSLPFLMIDLGPFSLFPYRVFVITLWLISLLYVFMNRGKVSINHIKIKPYIRFLVLWFSYAVLSLIWAVSRIDATVEIFFLFMGMSIILFVVYYFADIEQFKLFYYLWLLILVLSIGMGIRDFVIGQTLSPGGNVIQFGNEFAPRSFYKFQNFFSVFLALGIPFALTFIRYHKKLTTRFLFVGVLLLAFFLLIATVARSCYLAIFSSIVFWVLFLIKWKVKFKMLVILSLVILLLFISPLNHTIQNIYYTIITQITSIGTIISNPGPSLRFRINAIKNSLIFLVKSLGFGVGAGNVEYYMTHFSVYDVNENAYVHNWWIQILTNYGIFIFGCYITFYLKLFLNLYRAYAKLKDNQEKMICEALLMGMVGFFFAGMSNGTIIYFAPQWIFFAFALGFLNCYKIKQRSVSNHRVIEPKRLTP